MVVTESCCGEPVSLEVKVFKQICGNGCVRFGGVGMFFYILTLQIKYLPLCHAPKKTISEDQL